MRETSRSTGRESCFQYRVVPRRHGAFPWLPPAAGHRRSHHQSAEQRLPSGTASRGPNGDAAGADCGGGCRSDRRSHAHARPGGPCGGGGRGLRPSHLGGLGTAALRRLLGPLQRAEAKSSAKRAHEVWRVAFRQVVRIGESSKVGFGELASLELVRATPSESAETFYRSLKLRFVSPLVLGVEIFAYVSSHTRRRSKPLE